MEITNTPCQHIASDGPCTAAATKIIDYDYTTYYFCDAHYMFRLTELNRLGQVESIDDEGCVSLVPVEHVVEISKDEDENEDKDEDEEVSEEEEDPTAEPVVFTYALESSYASLVGLFKHEELSVESDDDDVAPVIRTEEEDATSSSTDPPTIDETAAKLLEACAAGEMILNSSKLIAVNGMAEGLANDPDFMEACRERTKLDQKKAKIKRLGLGKKPDPNTRIMDAFIRQAAEKLLVVAGNSALPGAGAFLQLILGKPLQMNVPESSIQQAQPAEQQAMSNTTQE